MEFGRPATISHVFQTVFCLPASTLHALQSLFLDRKYDTEQKSDIKSALNLFEDDRQSHRAAGDFLYFAVKQKGGFDNREQIKARREVGNVVEGHYDQQQKRGFSMRR